MCMTTAVAPLAGGGWWEFLGGVSRSINVSYTKAIPVGTKLRIESRVVALGKQMQMIRAEMMDVEGKVVFATCEQHKVHLKPFLREGEELREGRVVIVEKEEVVKEKAKL
ncbi:hypothetical protein BJ508DRAFT_413776 [Ascobolus immersus RN42]|uniref:Thioesterase domain-containing protein n=1 Tax=Ascobolus immersus RN42 TaxID=1160509 RepID=A0A3N4IMM3_ASCIM|nr:hypothetical protein BJ508DRAFT_413776 [Ascobolus immersus RN42]